MKSVRPRRADLKSDLLAGLPGAISSLPDGMAASVLAGVHSVHGLYASFAGPIGGGLTSTLSATGHLARSAPDQEFDANQSR